MEEVQILMIVVMILAIFWLTSGCHRRRVVEGYAVRPTVRRESQPCSRINRCGPGLSCFNGVCVVPKGIDDPFDLKE